MYFESKKISLIILGVTSLIFSRTMFFYFDDPEGTNLLVTTVMALIIYSLTLSIYYFNPKEKSPFKSFSHSSLTDLKRLLTTIFIQIIIVTILYFCLR